MKIIKKVGLSLLSILFTISLISSNVNADQYRPYEIGKDLKPGKYIVTSKNGTGDIYNSTYDFDFAISNGKPKIRHVHNSWHINLEEGQKVIANNFEANFQPDNSPKITQQGKIICGEYRIGNDPNADIEPGVYIIKSGKCAGEYSVNDSMIGGNVVFLSGLKKLESGEHRQHRVQLKDGDYLYSDIKDATLTKISE